MASRKKVAKRTSVREKRAESAKNQVGHAPPNQPEILEEEPIAEEMVERRHGDVEPEGVPSKYKSTKKHGRPRNPEPVNEVDHEAERRKIAAQVRDDSMRLARWETHRRDQRRMGVILPAEPTEDFEVAAALPGQPRPVVRPVSTADWGAFRRDQARMGVALPVERPENFQ